MGTKNSIHGQALLFVACAIAFLALAALAALAAPAAADDDKPSIYTPVYHPKLEISRLAGEIRIDGVLDDSGWRTAAKATNFAEHNPGDQTKPAVDTDAYITYDDENIYVAFMCYDDPKQIRATFCERDKVSGDDLVFFTVDPFGDATYAYEIAVNPYGIPADWLFSATTGEDASYDLIYTTAARIVENGWIAEMAIPFSSLRFPDVPEQTWRVEFWRNRPRESYFQYSWAAYDRNIDCWPCQWGTATGIKGIKPGKGIELLPAVVATQAGSLGEAGDFEDEKAKGDVSIGVTYDVSSELSAEATVNPDFSQVETDAAQIDVNSTFALFYPEKRPFFQEGNDLFSTTFFNAVYTRSINDPLLAGKTTYRRGSNSLAFLSARDEHSVITLPFEEGSEFVQNGESYSNILRYKRDFGGQSYLALVGTDRRFDGGGAGSLGGIDGQIRLTKSDAIRFQALASHTEEVDNLALIPDSSFNAWKFDGEHTAGLDGESFWGHALYGGLFRNTSNYSLSTSYVERSSTFRADNGFEPQNARRQGSFDGSYIWRFDKSPKLEYLQFSVSGARVWDFDGVRKDEWINPNLMVQTRKAYTGFHVNYMASNERYRGIDFNGIWGTHVCFSTRPRGEISLSGNINYGHRIARYALAMGKQLDYGLSATVKPLDRLVIAASWNHIESEAVDTGEPLFDQSIFWSRVSLQLSRELSMRLVTQYNDRYNTLDVDPLITYRINSLTMFYVGSTHDYRDFTYAEDAREGWDLTERQFFMKLQYLFQI